MTDSSPQSSALELASPAEPLTDWEKRKARIYREAAREAVLETLQTLGFDTDDKIELQKDMVFLRTIRRVGGAAGAKFVIGAVTFFFTVLGGAALYLIQRFIGPSK